MMGRPLIIVSAILVLSIGAGTATAQVINKRITIYDGALRVVDTPDNGGSYEALSLGAEGTGIASTNGIYLAPNQSQPVSFFRGHTGVAGYAGLYLNSGTAPFAALEAHGDSATLPTLQAQQLTSEGYAGYFAGDVVVDGANLEVTGSKNTWEDTSIGRVYLHAVESPTVRFIDYGSATMTESRMFVALRSPYVETIEPEYVVFLTARNGARVSVHKQQADGFWVTGMPGDSFTYEVVGTRKGFADQRF